MACGTSSSSYFVHFILSPTELILFSVFLSTTNTFFVLFPKLCVCLCVRFSPFSLEEKQNSEKGFGAKSQKQENWLSGGIFRTVWILVSYLFRL